MMTVLVALLAVVAALLVVLATGVLRSQATIVQVLGGLRADIGTSPDRLGEISGRNPDGGYVTIPMSGVAPLTLLAFLSTACTTCAAIWGALSDARALRSIGDASVVVVTKGPDAERARRARELAPRVQVVMSSEAWEAYGVAVAPYFVVVDGATSAVVAEGPATSWDGVVAMCRRSPLEVERS